MVSDFSISRDDCFIQLRGEDQLKLVPMNSAKVLKSRKRYESRKSQRFSNITGIRWSKAQARTPEVDAEVNATIYSDSINSNSPSDNDTESIIGNEPTEERVDNDVENVVPVEDHGNDVMDMKINSEILNNRWSSVD